MRAIPGLCPLIALPNSLWGEGFRLHREAWQAYALEALHSVERIAEAVGQLTGFTCGRESLLERGPR